MSPILLVLLVAAAVRGEKCDIMEFQKCVGQVRDLADGYAFHVTDEEQLKESCQSKLDAVKCANDFTSRCMKSGDKEVFKVTTGGKIKLVEELCTDGTEINKGYVENFDCWKKIHNDTVFCNEQFEKSQQILMTEDIIESLRMFHSCCGFEWHKQCKIKAAEVKCNPQARDMVDSVSTLMGGRVLSQLCGASTPTCHGLYGVDVEDLDTRYWSNSGADRALSFYSVLFVFVMFIVFY